MKRSWLLAVALLFIAGTVLAQKTAPEKAAPKGIRSERDLPDRYVHVVNDMLKYCQPKQGVWIDLGAGKGQVAIPLIEKTGKPVRMVVELKDADLYSFKFE